MFEGTQVIGATQSGSVKPVAFTCLQPDQKYQRYEVLGAAGVDGTNAPNTGAMALETRTEVGQLCMEAMNASYRAPVKLMYAASLVNTKRVMTSASLSFSAVSRWVRSPLSSA